MLRIQYLDKDRFMHQVAASKGSVYLHLDNGETCDLKKDSAATELFQMMNAPAKGFSISVADPADVTGFLHYMLEAGRKDRACEIAIISFTYYSKTRDPPRRAMPRSGPFVCFAVLQDAAADGLCHRQQFLLPDKAKLHLVLIRIADRQL